MSIIDDIKDEFDDVKKAFNKKVENYAKNVPGFNKALTIPLFHSLIDKIDNVEMLSSIVVALRNPTFADLIHNLNSRRLKKIINLIKSPYISNLISGIKDRVKLKKFVDILMYEEIVGLIHKINFNKHLNKYLSHVIDTLMNPKFRDITIKWIRKTNDYQTFIAWITDGGKKGWEFTKDGWRYTEELGTKGWRWTKDGWSQIKYGAIESWRFIKNIGCHALGAYLGPAAFYSFKSTVYSSNKHRDFEKLSKKTKSIMKDLVSVDLSRVRIIRGAYIPGNPICNLAGIAFDYHIFLRQKTFNDGKLEDLNLLHHELVHTEQYIKHGELAFASLYISGSVCHGYSGSPMEKEADERVKAGQEVIKNRLLSKAPVKEYKIPKRKVNPSDCLIINKKTKEIHNRDCERIPTVNKALIEKFELLKYLKEKEYNGCYYCCGEFHIR